MTESEWHKDLYKEAHKYFCGENAEILNDAFYDGVQWCRANPPPEVQALVEALRFYADIENFDEEMSCPGKWVREPSTVDGPGESHFEPDFGEIAEKALAKFNAAREGGKCG